MSSHVGTTLIKRYERSRLYDTKRGRYVATSELRDWQQRGIPFVVVDTEMGDDIIRVLLS